MAKKSERSKNQYKTVAFEDPQAINPTINLLAAAHHSARTISSCNVCVLKKKKKQQQRVGRVEAEAAAAELN